MIHYGGRGRMICKYTIISLLRQNIIRMEVHPKNKQRVQKGIEKLPKVFSHWNYTTVQHINNLRLYELKNMGNPLQPSPLILI